MADPRPGTPLWWLKRLHDELNRRQTNFKLYRRYVDGDHDLPLSDRAAASFAAQAGLSTTNLTGLVVETTAERMAVEGFRFGDNPDADKDAWRMWQAADFDAGSEEAITNALVYGRSFVSVAPNPDNPEFPRFYAEHPTQVVVAYSDDGQKHRVAALKEWTDEWTGRQFATLYTPESVLKFVDTKDDSAPGPFALAIPGWSWRELPNDPAISNNPLGSVPFFELVNRLRGTTRSEIADIITPQDRLNKIAFNTDAVSEYGAFRQKWVTGLEVPIDKDTGKPIEPFKGQANVAKLLVGEDPDTRFGDFNASDLTGYLAHASQVVAHIARISRIPPTYFDSVANVTESALTSLESGLVKKCRRRVLGYEPALEGMLRLGFKSFGDARADEVLAETVWARMDVQTPAQAMDAAVKGVTANIIPPQQAQEDLGYSETQRSRMKAWMEENDTLGQFASLLDAQATPPPSF